MTRMGTTHEKRHLVLWLFGALVPTALFAHTGQPPQPHDLWTSWAFDRAVWLSVLVASVVYARGVRALWARAGVRRGIAPWRVASFAAGVLALLVVLVSPLDALSAALFSAHMTQHLVLTLVVPPLVLLGEPWLATAWALPRAWSRTLMRTVRQPTIHRVWHMLTRPTAVVLWHALALALWHVPVAYDAALRHPAVHIVEHLSFLATALLFWRLVCDRRVRQHVGAPVALAALFTIALEGTLLGALLTMARNTWYVAHLVTTAPWGLTPLEDQQLAGLIMWIPAGLVYVGAAASVTAALLRDRRRAITGLRTQTVIGDR